MVGFLEGVVMTDKKRQVVILAGGKGTRLKEVSGDLPKPMVPILGRPLLQYWRNG